MSWIIIFFKAAILAGVVSFLIIILKKWHALDFLAVHTWRWLPWGCEFCLSFWFSVIIYSFVSITTSNTDIVFVVPLSTVLARKLLQ